MKQKLKRGAKKEDKKTNRDFEINGKTYVTEYSNAADIENPNCEKLEVR